MKRLTEKKFLELLKTKGIVINADYPQSAVLDFANDPQINRFWCIPDEARRIPTFVATLLDLLDPWENVYVWKHSGSWSTNIKGERLNDDVQAIIYKGIGLPNNSAEIIVFDKTEFGELVALVFNQLVFGWHVGDDLYIVPDNGKQIMKTDHHDVVHVEFLDNDSMERFVKVMIEQEFELPEEVPDDTFKKPTWMA